MAQLSAVENADPRSDLAPGRGEAAGAGYVGIADAFERAVLVDGEGAPRTLRLARSALTTCGYAWGRAGPGPRELARAILIDATGNAMLAERLCRPFTWEVVSKLPADGFRLSREEVLSWVEAEAGR